MSNPIILLEIHRIIYLNDLLVLPYVDIVAETSDYNVAITETIFFKLIFVPM